MTAAGQPTRPDYGIDAPGVLAALFSIGVLWRDTFPPLKMFVARKPS